MSENIFHIFPQEFLNKLINFSKETLVNLFKLCREAVFKFEQKQFYEFDPLVCENACHIRAFALWHIVYKYKSNAEWHFWSYIIDSLDEMIKKIDTLEPINEHTKKTIRDFLEEHHLYFKLNNNVMFDVQFVFLSYLLTLTKKPFQSSSFLLYEKTCLEELNDLGLVHNKIKSLVASAQKELSAMSCHFVQMHIEAKNKQTLQNLLKIRYDNHKRSYLPQYLTAKVILLNGLKNNIPLVIKVTRFVQRKLHDEIFLGFNPSYNKKDYSFTTHITDNIETAIICGGVINYKEIAETPNNYLNRLNQYSIMQVLLANFAAHPQFSGNLRETPCIYKEAIETHNDFESNINNELEEFKQQKLFANQEGCTLDNPDLLFLIHVYCDSISHYKLNNFDDVLAEKQLISQNNL